jgi:hypothetical protein
MLIPNLWFFINSLFFNSSSLELSPKYIEVYCCNTLSCIIVCFLETKFFNFNLYFFYDEIPYSNPFQVLFYIRLPINIAC